MSASAAPLLSVIVPTVGRPSLARTLRSLLQQRSALPWELILVGDVHAGTYAETLRGVPGVLTGLTGVTYVEHDGGLHAWGHPQRNHGATIAIGRYLAWLGDDDLYLPGAFDAIHRAILASPEPRVHLFRWIAPWRGILWETPGVLQQDHIDAENVVCPNVPDKLGTWTNRYQGDYDFIAETVANWGGVERVVWRPEVIAQAQPADHEDWTVEQPPVAAAPAEASA